MPRRARTYEAEVHGTIWLLARACRDGKQTEVGVGNLIDALRSTGARCPALERSSWLRASTQVVVVAGSLHSLPQRVAPSHWRDD
jgi:hypothetical protein